MKIYVVIHEKSERFVKADSQKQDAQMLLDDLHRSIPDEHYKIIESWV